VSGCTKEVPVRHLGGRQAVPRRRPDTSWPPATSENVEPRKQWCVNGVRLGSALGGAQALTYVDFNGREYLWGKIWLENCHRRTWQEKGSFFVGLQIIII